MFSAPEPDNNKSYIKVMSFIFLYFGRKTSWCKTKQKITLYSSILKKAKRVDILIPEILSEIMKCLRYRKYEKRNLKSEKSVI